MPFTILTALFVFLSINVLCSPAMAASITVSPSGVGGYVVMGEGMYGVSGIQLTLGYDTPALASPSVMQGSLVSGALLTSNTTIPGSIRIAVVKPSPLFGSGQIATVSFGAYNGAGGISSITARLIDTSGANIPVQTSVATGTTTTPFTHINPPSTTQPTTTQVAQTPASRSTTLSTTLSTGTTILGTVTMPGDTQTKIEPKQVEPPTNLPLLEPTARPEDVTPRLRETAQDRPVAPEKAVEQKQVNYVSILDRFKKFDGERTPAALMALFDNPVAKYVRQEPAIAISDGSSSVTIYANLPKGSSSPTLNLSGVETVAFERDDETGMLILEVLPKKNGIKASVAILTNQIIIMFRLTVVPPVAEITTEAAFAAFLKDSGAKKPRFDLNGDGVHDYLDDYIYTGNYLMKNGSAGKEKIMIPKR